MNLLYEVMADSNLLEEMAPSCDLAVVYEKADRDLIVTLMAWRKKGYSVMGVASTNAIAKGDYKLIVSYKEGRFLLEGTALTKEELEEKLGGL